jgi:hypothetical protein
MTVMKLTFTDGREENILCFCHDQKDFKDGSQKQVGIFISNREMRFIDRQLN